MRKSDTSATSYDELVKNYYGCPKKNLIPTDAELAELFATYYGNTEKPAAKKTAHVMSLSCDDGEIPRQKKLRKRPIAGRAYSLAAGAPGGFTKQPAQPPLPLAEQALLEHDLRARDEARFDILRPEFAPATIPQQAPSATPAAVDGSGEATTQDEFIQDMQAILGGAKIWDPNTRQAVERTPPKSSSTPATQNGAEDIFASIAQSMQYANAYDLGSVELDNRFDEFERLNELKQKARSSNKSAAPVLTSAQEFIADLDDLRRSAAPAAAQSVDRPAYSKPLYAAEEHAEAAKGIAVPQLMLGSPRTVPFTYGELMAMADLFESVDQMYNAPPEKLRRLKTLIQRGNVGTEEWRKATDGLYVKLAENNYEHFAPAWMANGGSTSGLTSARDNKSMWEWLHRRALESAAQPQANEDPLVINAYGDHYLTDAFAAGHMINKQEIIDLFKSRFFSGSQLNPAGKQFFGKVAEIAFRDPDVKRKISALETTCKAGLLGCFGKNIDSAALFADVLRAAAEAEPDRMANIAVDALHDRLNRDGLDVTNAAGDTWRLSGDGRLSGETLKIMKRAVQQSVDNVNAAKTGGGLFADAAVAAVWQYVPDLTAGSKQRVQSLAQDYTSPQSQSLIDSAAGLIKSKVDVLVDLLIATKKLERS